MGMYKYIREMWKKPKEGLGAQRKELLMQLRREPATVRIHRPTRLDRARSLGYKAKQGVIVVRQRTSRGSHRHPDIKGGRRPKASSQRKVVSKSYQQIAEDRVVRQYTNCEVLNSYPLIQDGNFKWFEIILVDRSNPSVLKDKDLNWIALHKGRNFRGLTSSGKKSRGLRNKGVGAEKIRPSAKARGGKKS